MFLIINSNNTNIFSVTFNYLTLSSYFSIPMPHSLSLWLYVSITMYLNFSPPLPLFYRIFLRQSVYSFISVGLYFIMLVYILHMLYIFTYMTLDILIRVEVCIVLQIQMDRITLLWKIALRILAFTQITRYTIIPDKLYMRGAEKFVTQPRTL